MNEAEYVEEAYSDAYSEYDDEVYSVNDDIDAEMDAYVEKHGGIDQAQCFDCGRPIVVFCDDPRPANEIICGRCKQGLAPEWEY